MHVGSMQAFVVCVGATATRVLLVITGAGHSLGGRIELSTAFTRMAGVKEGIALTTYGISPYTGAAFRGPPLILPMLASTINHPILYSVPFILADLLSALFLSRIASRLTSKPAPKCGSHTPDPISKRTQQTHSPTSPSSQTSTSDAPTLTAPNTISKAWQVSAQAVVTLFIWNPYVIATCISGSSGSFLVASVLLAVMGALDGAPLLSGIGLAAAAYLDPYSILLLVPLGILIRTGVEDITARPTHGALATSLTPCHPESHSPSSLTKATQYTLPRSPAARPRGWSGCFAFLLALIGTVSTLGLLSDITLRHWPEHACLGWLPDLRHIASMVSSGIVVPLVPAFPVLEHVSDGIIQLGHLLQSAALGQKQAVCRAVERVFKVKFSSDEMNPGTYRSPNAAQDWATEAYGGLLAVDDLTPNIGIWWYFVIEMFQEFRPFFQFVLHCHTFIFTIPMALRIPRRPLFLILMQLVLNSILKPYPTVSDTALYMALVPLFLPQLCLAKGAPIIGWSIALVSVIGPAMYHQWIWTGSGNSNFFYAATLAWGAVHVSCMLLMLGSTLKFDRVLAGKPIEFITRRSK